MLKLNLAEDVVPIGEFKTHASKYLRQLRATHRPMLITQNGKPAAVVLTPNEFEELGYRLFVQGKVEAGIEGARHRTYSLSEVERRFRKKARP
jgi:prevent-host-death family protein